MAAWSGWIIFGSTIIIKWSSLSSSLYLIFHTNSVFSRFFIVFPEENGKIAYCRQTRAFIHVTYIQWYFNIASELLAFHYDGTYYYFHFFIYYLSIFYYFFYFTTTLWFFSFITFSHSLKEECVLCCTSCTWCILIVLSYNYSYMHFNIIFNATLGRCNVIWREKINRNYFTSLFTRFYFSNNKLDSINGILDLITVVPSTWENVWWRSCADYLRSWLNSNWYLISDQWYSTHIQYCSLIPLVYFI